jgi:3D (Asp-Asp-Asp) domain-containing protein
MLNFILTLGLVAFLVDTPQGEQVKYLTPIKEEQLLAPQTPINPIKKINVEASYYTAMCSEGCTGVTATGTNVRNTVFKRGLRVIAVDPNVIPLGTVVTVKTPYSTFEAIADDTGGAIRGNKIDILVASQRQAIQNGRVGATVSWKPIN